MVSPTLRGFLVPYADTGLDLYPAGGAKLRASYDIAVEEENRKQLLCDDLVANGISLSDNISVDEFVKRLKKAKIWFDETSLRRIFSAADTFGTPENALTGRNLVDAFFSTRLEHFKMCEAAEDELHTLEKLLQTSEAELRKETARGALTPSGAASFDQDEESKLTVQIVSIQNFQLTVEEGTAFKISMECQNQAIETKTSVYRDGSVFWNEMFSFQIDSRKGDLHITLLKVDFEETPCGDASVILEDLADQKKHELLREVWGSVNCEMLLSCQWLFHKKNLMNTYVREFTAKKETKLRELANFQSETERLDRALLVPAMMVGGDNNWNPMGVFGILQGPEMLSRAIDRVMDNMKLTNYQIASQYAVGVSLVLCCIASYARPLFLDLMTMGFAFWCNLEPRRWSVKRYGVVIGAIFLSEMLDAVWIWTYFSAWKNSTVEADMQNVTKMFSIFNLLWKLLVFFFFWKCYYDLSKKAARQSATSIRHSHPHHHNHHRSSNFGVRH